jgi:hypothetical protein
VLQNPSDEIPSVRETPLAPNRTNNRDLSTQGLDRRLERADMRGDDVQMLRSCCWQVAGMSAENDKATHSPLVTPRTMPYRTPCRLHTSAIS